LLHTFSVTVVLGHRFTAAGPTNLPVMADRWTDLPLRLFLLELSFRDVRGCRAAADLL